MTSEQRIQDALKLAVYTKVFEVGENILWKVPVVFKTLFPQKKAIVVTDDFTWELAGKTVQDEMISAGIECGVFVIPDKRFQAEWKYVKMIDKALSDSGAIAISVGSGVLNDLCKLSSFHQRQGYMTVATAASVDGFSSFGASIKYKGVKRSFVCPAPAAMIADVNILSAAPAKMTSAGYADLAAKFPCGVEWMLADMMGIEPIIPSAWHLIMDDLDEMLANPEGIVVRDHNAISRLFEGLTLSGIAMQIARSSRPSSGTEHLFSHYLDMTGHTFDGVPQSHGFQVAIGTLTMCAFFDAFLSLDIENLDIDKCVESWPSLKEEQSRARELFKDFVDPDLGKKEITKKYSDADAVRQQLINLKTHWVEVKEQIKSITYTFETMQNLFRTVGAPTDPSEIGLTRQALKEIVPFAQLMRSRVNLLDIAKRAMVYDKLVDMVFGEGGVWDVSQDKMSI